MRKLFLAICLLMACSIRLPAQSFEAQQLLLNVEKLAQLKGILKTLEDGYTTLVKGYNTIRDLSEGNFSLHRVFLDGLLEVSPSVRNYKRIAEIIAMQVKLVKEYKSASGRFKASDLFSGGELQYLENVYDNLFKQSLRNLDDLTTVITASRLRMSDDERLREIDRIHEDMQEKMTFLRSFNARTSVLLVQRSTELSEARKLQKLHAKP